MDRIAVFFPGIGYHCDRPLLYFTRQIAKQAGYQTIITLSYSCQKSGLIGNAERMRAAGLALYEQTEDALKDIRWSDYRDVLFVSKSVGTGIAAAYARNCGIRCRNVFFTPVELTFEEKPQRGIAFTGTADPWVSTDIVKNGCEKFGIPLSVIENANHSLETDDPLNNIDILKNVISRTQQYILSER